MEHPFVAGPDVERYPRFYFSLNWWCLGRRDSRATLSSRSAERVGEAGVVELVVAAHPAVAELEDVDPRARARRAGVPHSEAHVTGGDHGVALSHELVDRMGGHVDRAAERLEEP